MAYPVSAYKTWSSGNVLLASDLNATIERINTEVGKPENIDDFSANATEYGYYTAPSASSLPTTLSEEIRHLRGAVQKIQGTTNWYDSLDAASNVKDLGYPEINEQTDSYELVLTDAGKWVDMNKATANNLTVPLNSSVAFPIGTTVMVRQMGAGATTIVATGGVTINTTTGLILNTRHSVACLFKLATDTWVAFGELKT